MVDGEQWEKVHVDSALPQGIVHKWSPGKRQMKFIPDKSYNDVIQDFDDFFIARQS